MATSEYELEMVCSEPTRRAAILAMFFERRTESLGIARQPMIPRILLRICSELLMPEKFNLGIDKATFHTILIVHHRFPEMSAAITYLYNQYSAIRGKIPILFNPGLLIQYIAKIKVWADAQFRLAISHYCQEAITELNKVEIPDLPASVHWKQVPKTSSSATTSVPSAPESQATNVIEIADANVTNNTNNANGTSEVERQSIQNVENPELQQTAPEDRELQSTEETPQASPTVPETSQSLSSVAEIVESISTPVTRQTLIQIAAKLQPINTTGGQSESTSSSSSESSEPSERTNKRPSNGLHDKSSEPTRLLIKRIRLQSPQSDREARRIESPRYVQEGKLEELNIPCGTVITILSRGYMGSTAVYVGPSKSCTHQRVIIMDKLGPLQTHLYGDTRARVESSRITHEVIIEENTREVSGALAVLHGIKTSNTRSVVVRITQENSPYKDKLATAFNSWSDNTLVWIHGETAPRYLDNATRVVFYVPNSPESPTD